MSQRARRGGRTRRAADATGEARAVDTTTRANGIWKAVLRDFQPPRVDPARLEALDAFIRRRTEEGGALPES